MTNFEKVGTFMKTFGQEVKLRPSLSSDKINKLRLSLIKEEFDELENAMNKKDLVEIADALTDILYVTYGAGHAFGINLDKCFDEVQNSNMSKLDQNGKPIYNELGKVMKGPGYFKPNLKKFLKWYYSVIYFKVIGIFDFIIFFYFTGMLLEFAYSKSKHISLFVNKSPFWFMP